MIIYTDEEWDRLAELVFVMRKNNPRPALVTIVEDAMQQLPEERRRSLRNHKDLEPLISRMIDLHTQMQETANQVPILEGRIRSLEGKVTSREAVLASITDEELVSRFGPKVLGLLVEMLTKKVVQRTYVEVPIAPPKARKKKVGVYGLKGDQTANLEAKLQDVSIIPMKQGGHPAKCDLYIVWVNFVDHGVGPPEAHKFKGGLNEMATFIKEKLSV